MAAEEKIGAIVRLIQVVGWILSDCEVTGEMSKDLFSNAPNFKKVIYKSRRFW